jgi:hypothetical protein
MYQLTSPSIAVENKRIVDGSGVGAGLTDGSTRVKKEKSKSPQHNTM